MNYLAYWDCTGFECIIDFTSYERKLMMAKIAGQRDPFPPVNPKHLILRAQANPQRFPEVWAFISDVDLEDLENIAKYDPQTLVNAIRETGNCLFKTSKEKSVIN